MDIYMKFYLFVVVAIPLYSIASVIVCTIFTTIFDEYTITIWNFILFPLLLVPILAFIINSVICHIIHIFKYSFNVLLFGRNCKLTKEEERENEKDFA